MKTPRLTIDIDFTYFYKGVSVTVKEDIIDGLNHTEFDPEKLHIINMHIAKEHLTHIFMLERIAKDLRNLPNDTLRARKED